MKSTLLHIPHAIFRHRHIPLYVKDGPYMALMDQRWSRGHTPVKIFGVLLPLPYFYNRLNFLGFALKFTRPVTNYITQWSVSHLASITALTLGIYLKVSPPLLFYTIFIATYTQCLRFFFSFEMLSLGSPQFKHFILGLYFINYVKQHVYIQ